jgi:ribosomal protein S18 acetylase RimI-like enzyme
MIVESLRKLAEVHPPRGGQRWLGFVSLGIQRNGTPADELDFQVQIEAVVSLAMRTAVHRLARWTDFGRVYEIYTHPAVIPYLGFDPISAEEFRSVYQGLLASDAFYVVEVEGRVEGFYKAARQEGRSSHVATLGPLAVAPERRGTGFAGAMLEEAISRLHAAGVLRFELMAEADNPRGIAFYRKLGFVQEGLLRAAYKRASDRGYTDEIFLARLLPPIDGTSTD